MYRLIIVLLCIGFCFSQVLEIDSIFDPGLWIDPDNIISSDDQYGQPPGNNDPVVLQIEAPTDTTGTIDSIKVFLEQYVSDTSRAAWRVRPIMGGTPGNNSTDVMGTMSDQLISFDISAEITGWQDLFDLTVDLRGIKVGGGQNPDWYADYLYVFVYSDVGIFETRASIGDSKLNIPRIVTGALSFSYYLEMPSKILISVYNSIGQRVLTEKILGVSGRNHINIGKMKELSRGVYYIHVVTVNNRVEKGKFILIQ